MIGGGDAGLCAQLDASGFVVRQALDPASAARALSEVDLVVLTSRWPHAEDLASACASRGGPPVVWSRGAAAPARQPAGPVVIGSAPRFQKTLERIAWAAPSEAPVLIEGESGTGKECLAVLLHHLSRRSGPLVKLNCATLTSRELDEALATFEETRPTRGTLLLDALSELDLDAQARLLEAIAGGRLGDGGPQRPALDLRLVGTSSSDLRHGVTEGRFRHDLYFRLAVLPIAVPPLRERSEDLAPLVTHFLERFSSGTRRRILSPAALERLAAHEWPGNVRELANLVRRLVLSSREERIGAAQVSDELERAAPQRPHAAASSGRVRSGASMRSVERAAIASALEETSGNRAQAARLLGISVRTLYNRLKRYQAEGRPLLESL